jgi:preprotein translocase subunit SecF
LDFVNKRVWFFLTSLLIITPGIVFLIIGQGLRPGIDFTGGSSMNIGFSQEVDTNKIRTKLSELGYVDAIVQKLGDDTFFLRTVELDESDKNNLVKELETSVSPEGVQLLSFDLVSPMVARETLVAAFWAVIAAAVGIFFYLWWAFRSVPTPSRYGAAAIIALIHDTVIVIGIFAILGVLFEIEVNTMFLSALLTVIGYSVNDTIVIFDRLRENILLYPNRSLESIANLSISESLGRSLNTSLTILFTILALMLLGGPTIRVFLWVLLVGVVVGTYSSIGIATQTLIVWEKGDVGRLFRRIRPASESN